MPVDRFAKLASSTAPHTWCHLDEARKALESGIGDGIGFVFTRASSITGIDLTTAEITFHPLCVGGSIPQLTQFLSDLTMAKVSISRGALFPQVDGKRKNFAGDGYRPKAGIESVPVAAISL